MAILEKEVWVKCGLRTDKHYEDLGYTIPRVKSKHGRLSTLKGAEILVNIEHLPIKSNVKITKICDEDGCGNRVPNQSYAQVLSRRDDGKDYCVNCSPKRNGATRKNNIPYKKTLEHFAKTNNKDYLIQEFSNKNIKKPSQVSRATHDEFLWECSTCKSEYFMKVSHRTSKNYGCPFCSGQRVNETNCLFATHPEVAKLLTNQTQSNLYTKGSHVKVDFTCPDCGNIEVKDISNVVRQGFSCSYCGDFLSYPEKFLTALLQMSHIEFKTQRVFEWSTIMLDTTYSTKKYDFYIPSLNCIIETHGRQHYEEGYNFKGGRSFSEELENDRIKEKLANENGIVLYIAIDCRFSEMEWIKNSIINSKLSSIVKLESIDWNKCHEFACSSMVKIISDLWSNENITSTSEISKLTQVSKDTVIKYLKQGAKLGWCDYNPNQRKCSYLSGEKGRKEIVQLTMQNEIIKFWNSANEASRELKISQGNISSACMGNYKSASGFKWMYKKDFDELSLIKSI